MIVSRSRKISIVKRSNTNIQMNVVVAITKKEVFFFFFLSYKTKRRKNYLFFSYTHIYTLFFFMDNNKKVPEWASQLTEKLITPSHISPLPSSAVVIHPRSNKDEQFEHYIDRQFEANDAALLKTKLSDTPSKSTTLRNSSLKPKDIETGGPSRQPTQGEEEEEEAWWLLSKNDQDGFYSICGLLFVFGFLFPPLWWIGSVWPKHVKEKGGKMAERWQKLNRIMSIGFSSILILLVIIFVILYATGYKF
jgi:hypothetical protein